MMTDWIKMAEAHADERANITVGEVAELVKAGQRLTHQSSEEARQVIGYADEDKRVLNTNLLSTNQQEKIDALVAELRSAAEKLSDVVGFEINPVHESEKPPGLITDLFNVWAEVKQTNGGTDEMRFASGMMAEDAKFVSLLTPANILTLLTALTSEREENERLSLEVTALKNTAPCLYPSKPGETRAGFSSNGVHVEGSQDSIKAVASWNHIATQAPTWSRAIDDANQRTTSAEAQITAQAETIGELEAIINEQMAALEMVKVPLTVQGAKATVEALCEAIDDFEERRKALSKARPDTGEQSQSEALAAAIYNANPCGDQETDLDGRPTGPGYLITWDQMDEYAPKEAAQIREVARLISEGSLADVLDRQAEVQARIESLAGEWQRDALMHRNAAEKIPGRVGDAGAMRTMATIYEICATQMLDDLLSKPLPNPAGEQSQ